MKIVCVDNFDTGNKSDALVAENVNPFYGEPMVEWLNQRYGGERSDSFFKLVEDDHRLYDVKSLYL